MSTEPMPSPRPPAAGSTDHDDGYDTRRAVPDFEAYRARRREASEAARRDFRAILDVPYGSRPEQVLDVFPAAVDRAPIELYVHGGAWKARSKDEVSFLARSFVPAGVTLVTIGFAVAPTVDLDTIVGQVREAVAWVHGHAAQFGADPDRLHLAGHSSGAHLAAMAQVLAAADGETSGLIKGLCLTSGLYDLEPVRQGHMNEWLGLDEPGAVRNSPIRHVRPGGPPLVIGVGGRETDAFRRQTEAYRDAWARAGNPWRQLELPDHHHYSLMLELADPASPVFAAVREDIERGTRPQGG